MRCRVFSERMFLGFGILKIFYGKNYLIRKMKVCIALIILPLSIALEHSDADQ